MHPREPGLTSFCFFLCTRVKETTAEDKMKLIRVLEFLKGARQRVIKMRPDSMFKVVAYINTSLSSHPDRMPHSGVVLQVGGAFVYFGCRKQKCVSKSATKAELGIT
jgi:hypothetical protein